MSQKPFMWNGNNPVEYEDPSGYCDGAACIDANGGGTTNTIFVKAEVSAGPLSFSATLTLGPSGPHLYVGHGAGFTVSQKTFSSARALAKVASGIAAGSGGNGAALAGNALRNGLGALGKSLVSGSVMAGVVSPNSGKTAEQVENGRSTEGTVGYEGVVLSVSHNPNGDTVGIGPGTMQIGVSKTTNAPLRP